MNRPDDRSNPADTRPAAARITVRRATVADADGFAAMLGHPEVFPCCCRCRTPTPRTWRARLADDAVPGKADLLLVAVTDDGEVVGGAGLHPVGRVAAPAPRDDAGHAGAARVAAPGRRHALMQALCDYADNWLGLLRLELEVYADNHKAQALYRRFGFVEEGVHRCDALRDGVYVDSLSMARLNPAPLRGFPRD